MENHAQLTELLDKDSADIQNTSQHTTHLDGSEEDLRRQLAPIEEFNCNTPWPEHIDYAIMDPNSQHPVEHADSTDNTVSVKKVH